MQDIYINSNKWFTGNCELCGDYLGDDPKIKEPLNYDILKDNYDMCRRCYLIVQGRKDINEDILIDDIRDLCQKVRLKLQIDKANYLKEQQAIKTYINELSDPLTEKAKCQICGQTRIKTEPCCDESDIYRDNYMTYEGAVENY